MMYATQSMKQMQVVKDRVADTWLGLQHTVQSRPPVMLSIVGRLDKSIMKFVGFLTHDELCAGQVLFLQTSLF